jgi:hypothetical protein
MLTKLKTLLTLLAVASLALATGCANYNPQQRPWDPKGGQALFSQIPNEEGNALVRCCGANPSKCERHQTDRC